MLLQQSNCGCGCSACAQSVTPNIPCTVDKCRTTLETTKIDTLVWLQGLNVNLCERFQRLSDVLSLKDCLGNTITLDTPLVTCADFKSRLCEALATLAENGEATASTLLVGADCKLYTVPTSGPVSETPNTVTDTATINFTCTGTLCRDISGSVVISDDAGNVLETRTDGLYVPTPSVVVPTACAQLQAFATGADVTAGTILIGADCQKHVFPGIPSPGFTVTDTSSVDLVLVGTNLQANVRLDPDFIGTITADGLELTCADVLQCAPPVTVTDTNTVDLTLTGQLIQADVKISSNTGNNITAQADGLFLSVCDILDDGALGIAVPGSTQLVGADCNRYTLPTGVNLSVIDTTSVNLFYDGVNLQADVNLQPGTLITLGPQGLQVLCEDVQDCIFNTANNFWSYNDLGNSVIFNPSSDLNNQLTTGSDGRPYVPPQGVITVSDTDCIGLNLDGFNNLTASLNLDPNPSNVLFCGPGGLFAPAASATIVGVDTSCMDITVVPSGVSTFTISVQPIISVDAGNVLQCRPNGMYSPSTSNTVSDTNTVNLTLTGINISADVIVSPNAGNQLTPLGNGLFVPPSTTPFTFASPLSLTHNIVHNRGNSYPLVTVWDTATGQVIIPDTIQTNTPNDFTITFFVARAIAGSVL